jgi:gliding motility-associated-like protein
MMDNSLQTMIWSSFIGGNNLDAVYGIVLDNNNNVFVCGGTNSTNFTTTAGVLYPTYVGGTVDGFITKISANGSSILKSTYYGSAFYDQTYLMDRSKEGKIYVFGQTAATGSEFINNALWNHPGGGQFISKLMPDLDSIVWSTAFGTGNGGPDISPSAFLVDLCDMIYLSGWGGSVNGFGGTSGLPITGNAYQSTTDNSDFYLLVINDDASALVYGTYFGGPVSAEHVDGGTSRFDRKGKIYQSVCAGCGGNSDFPTTPSAWSNINKSTNCNNGTFKFDFMLPLTIADFQIPPITCIPDSVHFVNTSHTGGAGMDYYWNFGDGQNSTLQNPIHFYSHSGVYTVTLAVADTGTCNGTDTISRQVVVLSNSSDQLPTKYICLGNFIQIGIIPVPDTSVTYNWTPITGLSNPHVSNPIASPSVTTNYTCLVSNGYCTDTLRQTVVVYDLHAFLGNDTTTCSGILDLTANSSGGVTFFQWSSNQNFTDTLNSSTSDSTLHVNITTNTTFYILVKNPYCQDIDSVKITMIVLGSDSLKVNPTCHDFCNGIATVQPFNGTAPYTYLWSTGSNNDTIYNLCPDPYSVTIHDAQGCVLTVNFNLQNPTPLVATLNVVNMHCPTSCVGQVSVNTAGSNPPYNYLWSNGQSGNPLTGLCPGTYTVTVSDIKNCNLKDSAKIIIDSIFNDIHVWTDKDTIYEGQSTQLHSTHVNGCYYSWAPSSSLDNPATPDPIASPLITTTYILTISDGSGCEYLDTITIYVIDVICEEPYVFLPNAFSPNNDNQNDILYVRTTFAESVFLEIYDRWGEKLFETNSSDIGWDGKYKGKYCNPGVYVYVLEVVCFNKQHFRKKGNITLIR